jgi:hypothetical protein
MSSETLELLRDAALARSEAMEARLRMDRTIRLLRSRCDEALRQLREHSSDEDVAPSAALKDR